MASGFSVNTTKHYGTKAMEVIKITEHESGGATYEFDLTEEERDALCRNGILWAIVCGCTGLTVEEAMKYSKYAGEDNNEDTEESLPDVE